MTGSSRCVGAGGEAGFTLVEVLVTMVLFAIGLLAVATMQMSSISSSNDAYLRTQAMWMAYDLADRMRSNPVAVGNNDYLTTNVASAATVSACTTATGCTPAQMAQNDLAEWDNLLNRILPSGQGTVCRDSSPQDGTGPGSAACTGGANPYVVKIWWYGKDRQATQRFTLSFEP